MLTLLAVILMAQAQPPQVGAIHILVEAGDTVFLDAREMGMSSTAAGGMLINNVPVGEHEVIVRTPAGGNAVTKVVVQVGETSMISISSLGLRTRSRGTDAAVEMQVGQQSTPCDLRVGTDHVTAAGEELRIDHVHPGPQKVAIACGARSAAADVEIAPGKIVTFAADLTAHKLRVVGERDRVTSMVVPTVQDAIMRLDLPFSWKRTIAATLSPGMRPKSITQKGMIAEAYFVTPDWEAANNMAMQLKERSEVQTVYVSVTEYTKDGYVFLFRITFRTL
jgi:hypothetical protein